MLHRTKGACLSGILSQNFQARSEMAGLFLTLEPLIPSQVHKDVSAGIEQLERRMTAAADAMDFEEARRLRDQINLIRGGASPEEAARADTSGLSRQKSGAMGIGTSQSKPVTPPGWKPPPKPDTLTSGQPRKR